PRGGATFARNGARRTALARDVRARSLRSASLPSERPLRRACRGRRRGGILVAERAPFEPPRTRPPMAHRLTSLLVAASCLCLTASLAAQRGGGGGGSRGGGGSSAGASRGAP